MFALMGLGNDLPDPSLEADPGFRTEAAEAILAQGRGVDSLVGCKGIPVREDVSGFHAQRPGRFLENHDQGRDRPSPYHGVQVAGPEPRDVPVAAILVRERGYDGVRQGGHER